MSARLSIVITIVSGGAALQRCLEELTKQADPAETEIIVPYDQWTVEAGDLAKEFPQVRFYFYDDFGGASSTAFPARAHRLYDRRRAVGLRLAGGEIIAMTEDHAVPAADWIKEICSAHERPCAVIGGAVENAVDRPLNWALYYCDFGRYGRPLSAGATEHVSDVNVSYKRGALNSIRDVWNEAYHETIAHWALRARGEILYLDPRIVVYQSRPAIRWRQVYRERIDWGRAFAEGRVTGISSWRRLIYAAGAPALPVIISLRVWRRMRHQRRSPGLIIRTLPVAGVLLTGWALGEMIGYVVGARR
ncbi:MAG TPA: glycosyltransferase [Blastocatellia bacterium]|nr:glycosyltransferase [Blastocatellia bacterium]